MTTQLLTLDLTNLQERFPDAILPDERKGYEGHIVKAERLIEVATALRDEYGYDYLSSVTGVDYLPNGMMEVVYHLYRSTGGSALVIKVQVPRDNPVVPTLYYVYPGADFQEREAWDLLGIKFEGHPNLKRILMWEGYEGHPLRKDWREAYYEEDLKPFGSRWPGGHIVRSEDSNPFSNNVDYPAGFDPEAFVSYNDVSVYKNLKMDQDLDDGDDRPPQPPTAKVMRRFYGSVKLNQLKVSSSAGQIADEVVKHLAGIVDSEVEVVLEVRAKAPGGIPDSVVRTVSENSKTLKFQAFEFEEE